MVGALAATRVRPVTALLIGWDGGAAVCAAGFAPTIRRTATTAHLRQVAGLLDAGSGAMLLVTPGAAASLGAIVAELAQAHGRPHGGWIDALAG